MKIACGRYCKKIRYEAQGEPLMCGFFHCRECQYGAPDMALYCSEKQGFQYLSEDLPRFGCLPG
ncbi:MAG: hypothetical protein P8J79_07525 [Halioglobus sp.]|nr:hypothetical protein [Halioglobus sp.]